MAQCFDVHVCDAGTALRDAALVAEWDRFLQQHAHPNVLFASPPWLAHLVAQSDELVRIWTVRGAHGELMGILPVQAGRHELQFSVSHRVLARKSIRVGRVLGSLPLLPDRKEIYERVFKAVLNDLPHSAALHCEALPTDSFLWRLVTGMDSRWQDCYLHVTDGPRPWHLTQLTTLDAYLKAMSSKARANVRREVRHLREHARGKLELRVCQAPEDVPEFLRQAAVVSRRSWQHRVLGPRIREDAASRQSFADLARRGLLRSYLLVADDAPCAFVIGYQHAGVYHYAEVGFDEALRDFSPGTVLLFLILEDLHAQSAVTTLNFGVGDATYKRRFGNLERADVGCLLMRNGLSRRLLTTSHAAFNRSVRLAKRLLSRRVTK